MRPAAREARPRRKFLEYRPRVGYRLRAMSPGESWVTGSGLQAMIEWRRLPSQKSF